MKKIRFFYFLFFIFSTFQQYIYAQQNEIKNGYKISIKLNQYPDNTLYLVAYKGGDPSVIDSAFSKNGVFTFTQKQMLLQSGIYSLLSKTNESIFDILIDQSRFFKIETNFKNPLNYISIKKSEENILFFEYQKAVASKQDLSTFMETIPNSFLSKYIKAIHFPITETFFLDTNFMNKNLSTDEINQYIFNHYFDHIDLSDKRLFRTPLKINTKFYFSQLFSQMVTEDHEMFQFVDQFFKRTIDTNTRPIDFEIQNFYVKKLMQLYMNNIPQFDTLYLYLYDHYFYPEKDQWGIFDDSYNRIFSMISERKRRTMPGRYIEPLIAYDSEKQAVNSKDIQSKFTIIWFWDPDCEHCVTETPVLHEFYKQKHRELNFEVIAVSVTDDYDRWIKFIQDHHLEWINLSYAMGEPNYDFLDYFDLTSTPGVFIIDNDHKIIGRQISLDKIQKILKSNTVQ